MGITTLTEHSQPIPPRIHGSSLALAGIGLTVAVLLIAGVGALTFTDSRFAVLASYLCVWVPLLLAVLVARARSGSRPRILPLRRFVRPLDLLWGLGIGLLARTGTSLIEVWGYGNIGSAAVSLGETTYDAWWLFGAVLAPVILAPWIEELFFRGLVLTAVYEQVALRTRRGAAPIAIAVSGLTFALMHLSALGFENTTSLVVVGASTLLFGLAAAGLALSTGRIGGAVIAHITFNALVIVPALL